MRARWSAVAGLLLLGAFPAAAEPVRVAMLPVVVHSDEPDAGYLSAGLGEMLSARLERSGEIAVLRVPAEGAGALDPAAVAALARDADAAFVLYGAFTRFGGGASLDVRCDTVGGDAPSRRVFVQSGTLEEIIPKLDPLAERIARHVLDGSPPEPSAAAAAAPGGPDPISELRSRLDALERVVYGGVQAASGASGPPADVPAADGNGSP